MRRMINLLALITLASVLGLATSATAQDPTTASYVTPFPEGDVYRLQVYGDAFAEGLLGGLIEAFAADTRIQVQRKHRPLSGAVRPEFEDETRAEEQPGARELIHIGVLMMGIGDRQSIRLSTGKRLALGTEEWRQEYGRRIDRFMKALKKRAIALYVVGQPILRRNDANEDAQMINDVMREKAYLNGIRYIDAYTGFADEAGNYNAYGPDLTGKIRLLRDADGITFTSAGNRKLAHFVEREMTRDLAQAKAERAVPLAGSEAEQRRINPHKADSTAQAGSMGTVSPQKEATGSAQKGNLSGASAPTDAAGEAKADNSRIALKTVSAGGKEETVTIDILRPAIPAAVIALMTRKELNERPVQPGDVISEEIGEGLVVLSSITPANIGGARNRRVAPVNTPYYRVLYKGERLAPKPGRADDFTWPRPEPAAESALAAPESMRVTPRAAGAGQPHPRPAPRN
jgi:hypothetical protein